MSTTVAVVGVATVLCGCQINNFSLEAIVSVPEGKKFGVALTFIQFAFIAALALLENLVWQGDEVKDDKGKIVEKKRFTPLPLPIGLRRRELDTKWLMCMAFIFWLVSVINNLVFKFHISMPLHNVFRSSSLITNIIVGFTLFGRRYSFPQILCAVAVTIGLTSLTMITSAEMRSKRASEGKETDGQYTEWITGISLLVLSVTLSAALGLIQDRTYSQARKEYAERTGDDGPQEPRWREALFYSHAMTLPLFLVFYWKEIVTSTAAVPPELWKTIAVNVLSQYACIRGVYTLTDATSAFTMTLVITLRKFFSLLISIWWFGHAANFEAEHWASMLLTMLGASAYAFMPSKKKLD